MLLFGLLLGSSVRLRTCNLCCVAVVIASVGLLLGSSVRLRACNLCCVVVIASVGVVGIFSETPYV